MIPSAVNPYLGKCDSKHDDFCRAVPYFHREVGSGFLARYEFPIGHQVPRRILGKF